MRNASWHNIPAATATDGKQRLLEIAVAVTSAPSVLLLDEPAAGVPEEERHGILDIVGALPQDVTVVLIERLEMQLGVTEQKKANP